MAKPTGRTKAVLKSERQQTGRKSGTKYTPEEYAEVLALFFAKKMHCQKIAQTIGPIRKPFWKWKTIPFQNKRLPLGSDEKGVKEVVGRSFGPSAKAEKKLGHTRQRPKGFKPTCKISRKGKKWTKREKWALLRGRYEINSWEDIALALGRKEKAIRAEYDRLLEEGTRKVGATFEDNGYKLKTISLKNGKPKKPSKKEKRLERKQRKLRKRQLIKKLMTKLAKAIGMDDV